MIQNVLIESYLVEKSLITSFKKIFDKCSSNHTAMRLNCDHFVLVKSISYSKFLFSFRSFKLLRIRGECISCYQSNLKRFYWSCSGMIN